MKVLSILLLLALVSCGGNYVVSNKLDVVPEVVSQLNGLYDPWVEKGFCVSRTRVHNVLVGGWMSSELPLCEKTDIVFHSHPVWAESFANFFDVWNWEEYRRRYGNGLYGIMLGRDDFRVYRLSP